MNIQAKEMLLLAETAEKQKNWVQHLSKKISKKGIIQSGSLGLVYTYDLSIVGQGDIISIQYVIIYHTAQKVKLNLQ